MRAKGSRRGLAAVSALLLLLAAAGAQAQGLYFKEIRKDGRIYVFNDAAKAEAFEKGGEMGASITRVGAGPNGETVVADSETALELFFFKYGISQVVEKPAPPVQRVEWRDGKTRLTLGKGFYLEMSNRLQLRYTHELPDDSVQVAGTGAKGDGKGSFRIRRAKFKLEGWFYKPELEYEVQLNWPDASAAQPNRFLEDANIDWDASRRKVFRVRFGQFKAPYGRQQLTSSGSQQFVDRAITDERYNPGRETGLALWGTLGGNKLTWQAMASNGNGRSQGANDNARLLYTARVMWQPAGRTRMNQWSSGALMTEGDLGDSTDKPLFAVAANFLRNDRHHATANNDLDDTQWSGDLVYKYRRFSVVGEYHYRESQPETGAGFKDRGWLAQASYAFKAPRHGPAAFWEIAFRYAEIDPSSLRPGDRRKEIGGALGYYYNRHNLKVQADFRNLKDDAASSGEGTSNNEARLQAQLIF